MALFNYANREITAKVVYYGPGICGKTTSLQHIHERIAPAQRGRLLSLATETDRTIFFDLLPLKLGEIKGFKLRFQLYTVPGQVKYNKTRKLVLQGADAVVFVADSQVSRREANIESFNNLRENLQEQGKQLEEIPLVYEYNKRDMENILSIEQLNHDLNAKNLPYFAAVAIQGAGIMETLEAISKMALQHMEQRLMTGTEAIENEPDDDEDISLMMDDSLLDLTGAEGGSDDSSDLPYDDLGTLEMESDLTDVTLDLESKPIGYDNNIPVQEFEIQSENVAQVPGTMKESEFFNLKDVEEQALRELEDFLQGEDADESMLSESDDISSSLDDDLDGLNFETDLTTEAGFSFDQDTANASPSESTDTDEPLSFDLGDDNEEESELALSLDEDRQEDEEAPLSFDLDESEDDKDQDSGSFDMDDNVLDFSMSGDGERSRPSFEEESSFSAASLRDEPADTLSDQDEDEAELDGLDLSDSILEWTGEYDTPEPEDDLPAFGLDEDDNRAEPTRLNTPEDDLEDDLMEFNLDEDDDLASFEPTSPLDGMAKADVEPLDLSEDDLGGFTLDDESSADRGLSAPSYSEDAIEEEPFDFEITDSVRFEMQPGAEISSVTPFEQQLDQLSGDAFAADEETSQDEFQPHISDGGEEEAFQLISDEWTRLMVLAKHFFHRGEGHRAQRTVSDNVQAALLYYFAIETGVKAVASKYEACNPAIASLRIMFESIEEETSKPVAGIRSVMDKIVKLKDNIQMETAYPDDEECEMAARICERFLGELAQNFLTIDFGKLSPVLAKLA